MSKIIVIGGMCIPESVLRQLEILSKSTLVGLDVLIDEWHRISENIKHSCSNLTDFKNEAVLQALNTLGTSEIKPLSYPSGQDRRRERRKLKRM